MPRREHSEREQFLKSFFGHVRFLDIAGSVLAKQPEQSFFALELVEELEETPTPVSQSVMHAQLKSLEAQGIIERLPSERGVSRVDYVRTDSPAWEIVEVAVKVCTELFPIDSSDQAGL